jgi:hypothetical protein
LKRSFPVSYIEMNRASLLINLKWSTFPKGEHSISILNLSFNSPSF